MPYLHFVAPLSVFLLVWFRILFKTDSYLLILGLSTDIVWSSSGFRNIIIPSLFWGGFHKDGSAWKCLMWAKNRKFLSCSLWFCLPLKCILTFLLIHKVNSRTIMQLLCFLLMHQITLLFACLEWRKHAVSIMAACVANWPFSLFPCPRLLSVLLWPISQLFVLSWI